jgi:hypothetical protein
MRIAMTVMAILACAVVMGARQGGTGTVTEPPFTNPSNYDHACIGKDYEPVPCPDNSVHRADGTDLITPTPEWVPDPSAGHYDCPDGWTAYQREEPNKWSDSSIALAANLGTTSGNGVVSAIYRRPQLDKKGHELGVQPPPPICIKDSK